MPVKRHNVKKQVVEPARPLVWKVWFQSSARPVEETRKLLAKRESCDGDEDGRVGSCEGWAVFDTDGSQYGDRKEIERCDVCAPGKLRDNDAGVLPEAIEALSKELAEEACGCVNCVMTQMARSFSRVEGERFYILCARCGEKTFFDEWYAVHHDPMLDKNAPYPEGIQNELGAEPLACMHCRGAFLTLEEDKGD